MSLKDCLKKYGLDKYEATILRDDTRGLITEGESEKDAAIKAVNDRLDIYNKERENILSQIREQDGVLPVEKEIIPSIFYQTQATQEGTTEFKVWFNNSKIVDEAGDPLVVYHGTTHDIEEFSLKRGNPENDFGIGFYFTNSVDDVSVNYAGEGPDLTNRIESRAEFIADDKKIEMEEARKLARKELSGAAPNVLPVYISMQNPVIIGGPKETYLGGFEFDEETGEESGPGLELYDAIINVAIEFEDGDGQKIWNDIADDIIDESPVSEIITKIKESEGSMYMTNTEGQLNNGEFVRQVFEYMGFDGIIDNAVDVKFGSQREMGQSMEGMDSETVHIIAFKPEQIKSSIGNIGAFDPSDPRILFQKERILQRGRKTPRGLIQFMPDGSINISLLKDANLSTFLHETGHLWLEELIDDATSEGAPTELSDDLDKILKHIGVEAVTADGADAIRSKLQTENHENFAKSVEKYLMEGKSPSIALRRAFAAFRAWLVAIYKAIGPDAKLNKEIREVMDRLIATDEEIANARAEGEISPLFSSAEDMGVTETQFKAFRKTVEDASRAAQEELEQKLIREYMRERKAWWNDERDAIVEDVSAKVDAMQVYKAIAVIKAEDGPRLNRKIIRESIYGDALKRLPKGTTVKGGFHPDEVAELLDYSSGQELVLALAAAAPRKQVIEAEADRIMRERHGDMMTDGTLHEAAQETVQNDLRAEVIVAEMKALNKKAREVKPFVKAAEKERKEEARAGRQIYRALVPKIADVRARAKILIAGKTVREITPYQYFVAARKASRSAIEAVRKGDFLMAGHQKGFELLSMEMYREAIRVRKEIDNSLTKLRKAFVSDIKQAKTKNIDMVNAARAILAAHGIGKADTNAGTYLEKIRKYDPEVYENLRDIIEPALTDQRDYRDMSAEEFFGMRDGVFSLMHNARRSKQIEIEGKLVDRDIVINDLIGRIGEFGKKTKLAGYHRSQTKWEKTQVGLLGVKAVMRRVEAWVDSMDGGDPDGVFRKYLWTPVVEAVYKFREMNKSYLEKYLDTVKIIEETLNNDKIEAPEIQYQFNGKLELLHALLHTGNDSNKSKLLRGRGWGELNEDKILNSSRWDSFIERMINEGMLTKADYVFAQGVWDLLEELKPMAQKAHHQMYGYYFDEVTANEIDTPFGKFRGGYIPAVVDPDIVADQAIKRDADELLHGQNSFAFPTTGRGATMKRIEAYAKPLQLDMRTIPAHINWVLRFSIIEPAVKDVGRLVINHDFRAAMDAMDPAAARHMLMPWLQRTARQTVAAPGMLPSVDKFWRTVRRRTGMQIMVLNVVNTMQQFTGLSIAKTKLKRGSMRNAFWLYMTKNAEVTQFITDSDPMMRTRLFTQHVEVQQHIDDLLLNPTKYEKVRDFTDKHGYFLQIGTQSIVDKIVWFAAYNDSIADGRTHRQSVLHAASVVRETQGSFAPEDISRIESGTPFMRAFLMFFNYFNMQANLLGTEFNNIATNEMGLRKGAGRAFYLYVFGFMIPAFIGDGLIRAMMAGEPDDEGDGYIDDYIAMFFGTQIRTALAMVPAIGPIGSYAYDKMTGRSRYGDRITASPVVSVMESAVRAPESVYKAIVEDGNQKKAVKDALNALGMATGLPFGALARPLGYLADVQQGKSKPENVLDVTRGLLSGRDVRREK